MAHEIEAVGVDALGAAFRPRRPAHVPPPGTPCANCATPLQGPWCHACGQSAEDLHRSTLRLIAEAVEGLFHFDGRLWRTVPDLMIRPGRLTRRYLDGHRAPQVPPLRLFLVVLLALFVIGGLTAGAEGGSSGGIAGTVEHLSPAQRARVLDAIDHAQIQLGSRGPDAGATHWLRVHLERVVQEPRRFLLIVEQWSERFAFLMLPVAALLLSLLFVFQRRFYLFDHIIFSLHSLSAMGLLLIVSMLGGLLVGEWARPLLLGAPFHLYGHMRGVYRTRVIGTLLRMTVLFVGSLIAATLLFVSLLAVGLSGM